ncbi:MAG TPA: hypothetical protein VFP53_03695 [Sphingomicrobium sp.]|nr:hypothetical protein [Sphingomicrobium sp.]
MLSAQAAYAAPGISKPAVDPLISLSVLGTAQSRAAVCAGASAAAAAAAATAGQAAKPGCVLPVTDAAPPPPPPLAVAPPPAGPGIGTLPLLLGLAALIGIAALILSGDDDSDGDLTPVSPS